LGTTEGKRHLKDLVIDDRKLLKQIFNMRDGKEWMGLIWVRKGKGGGRMQMR
jgi:hypothetical protein